MTLKPNYLRAVAVTHLWIGGVYVLALAVNRMWALPVNRTEVPAFLIFSGSFMAAAVCVMFVPRELSYDAQGFSCRMVVQGSHAFDWDKLEAYGSGNGVFLLKFEGRQAIQISGYGFPRKEWREFKGFMKRTFPDKKCWIWFGPMPVMRKR